MLITLLDVLCGVAGALIAVELGVRILEDGVLRLESVPRAFFFFLGSACPALLLALHF